MPTVTVSRKPGSKASMLKKTVTITPRPKPLLQLLPEDEEPEVPYDEAYRTA